MQRARNLFDQNKIAIIWDFDKTLIPYDMQRPLFQQYGVDEETFWQECNALPDYYRSRGYELVSRDQMYLLHILSYVKAGRFKGLNNSLLRQLGSQRVDAAGGFGDRQLVAAQRGDAGAVVAPIFQPPQTGDDKPARVARADITDDSTHAVDSTSGAARHLSQERSSPGFITARRA